MPAVSFEQFRSHFRGEIIQPGGAAYESARKVYNGMIDKRPRLIAQCVDVADVVAAVDYGRENKLLTAIKKKYDPDNFFRVNQNIRPV